MQTLSIPHRNMPKSKKPLQFFGQTARDKFLTNGDVLHITLELLPLVALMNFGQTVQWARSEVVYMIRKRVIHYTLPFFVCVDDHQRFFQNLEDSRSWIVGCIALATVSFSCDPVVPHLMTVLSPSFAFSTWREFMVADLGFTNEGVHVPTGYYAGLARYIMDFTHVNNPVRLIKPIAERITNTVVGTPHKNHGVLRW
jgi:hypothetical protein